MTGLVGAMALWTSVSRAQDPSSPMQFWLQNAPKPVFRPIRPPHHPTFRPRRTYAIAPSRAPQRRNPAVAPAAPSEGRFVLAVFGDSLAEDLSRGLTDAYQAKSDTSVLDATSESATLTQGDGATWNDGLAAAIRKAGHLDAAVMMVGSADDDSLVDAHGSVVPMSSPEWRQLYGERVERIASAFKEKHIPLIWVGLPVVRDGEQARDYADINAILREHATKLGATYVDTWEAFTNEAGQYDPYGPDVNGKVSKLRRGDGQRFTNAGARKLAGFLEPDLKREKDRVQAGRQLASLNADDHALFDQALQVDVNAQIRREAGLPVEPAPASLQPKDLPVVELTAAPRASEGQLATLATPLALPADMDNVLGRGEPPPPRRGRTDDFSWPPP